MSSAAAAFPQSVVATVKLIHVFSGIYIWEFVSTLGFEFQLYTRRRRFRWSAVPYVVSRLLALGSVVCELVGFNVPHMVNCMMWFRFTVVLAWASICVASLLIVFRGIAIWAHNPYIYPIMVVIWLVDVGVVVWTVTLGGSEWTPAVNSCNLMDTGKWRWGILVNFVTDMSLLSIMFAGVLSKHSGTGLWRVLYFQGLTWLLMAVCSKIPNLVLTFINIDDGWNLMFQTPHAIVIVIVATRVYRDLFEYINPLHNTMHPRLPENGIKHQASAMEVTVHKTVEIDVEMRAHTRTLSYTDVAGDNGVHSMNPSTEREAKQMYFEPLEEHF